MYSVLAVSAALVMLILVFATLAQAAPAGGEFKVNTTISKTQDSPSVATDSDGDYVVTWQSYGQDGSLYGVYGQRYTGNTAPVANNQMVPAFNEDASKLITLSATDADNNSLIYKVTSLPTNGKLYKGNSLAAADEITNASLPFTLPSGGNQVTYVPNANYNNTAATADTFKFKANDGTVDSGNEATVSVTVSSVDDSPVAVDDTKTVAEDDAATAIDVLANDTDIDAGAKTIQSATDLANGTVVVTGGGSGLTYQPDPNYCNNGTPTDNFTYTLKDGSEATVAMTVTCVNDAPGVSNNKGSQNVQYSDPIAPVTISASDVDTARTSLTASSQFNKDSGTFENGLPAGLFQAVASTGANERSWTLSGNGNVAPGTYVVRVTASDGAASASSDVTIIVAKEDATAGFNGPLFYAVPSGSANVTLSAVVTDAADDYRGDIRNATVTFVTLDWTAYAGCTDRPVALLTSGDTTVGVATCTVPLSFATSGSTQYTVGIKVGGYYTNSLSAADEFTVVTVSQAVNGMITGGGYLVNEKSFGQYAGTAGQKTNFGFNVKYTKSLTNLQGSINTIIRSGGKVYQIKGNAMSSLTTNLTTATAKTATFNGKANLRDITNPLAPVSLGGNLPLQVTMTDKGEPGSSDTIGIQLSNTNGSLLFSSNWSGTKTVEQLLRGGNLVVR
jgi:VCBS repeat-containing protein